MDNKILRLYEGDEIVQKIIEYCDKNNIPSAWIWGIGAVSQASIAAFELETKKYHRKDFNEPLEIGNLTGNIGKLDGKTVAHLHIVLSNLGFDKTFTGHLDKAIVAATCEICVMPLEEKIIRELDNEIGLNLIKPQ